MKRRSFLQRSGVRLVVCILFGVAVALAAFAADRPLAFGVMSGWAGGAVLHCLWVWLVARGFDAPQTADHAQEEDPSVVVADLTVLAASVASLGGVGFLLSAGGPQGQNVPEALLGAGCVVAAWFVVHLAYMLRYARLYYGDGPAAGGIDFEGGEPDYWDFAYVAFDLGMTYQISDTSLKNRWMRRVVLKHTLLSYALGAGVIATTINLVVSLAQSSGH